MGNVKIIVALRAILINKFQVVVLVPSSVWGRHAPTRSSPQEAGNIQELKIFGHGMILALTNSRKPRTAQLIQLAVLGFLLSDENMFYEVPA